MAQDGSRRRERDPPYPARSISRRTLLRAAALSCGGLAFGGRPRMAAVAATPARARSCIVLWMAGGPPQHETWDPKPSAPAEVRGPFGSIESALPGVRVGELMPRTAAVLDRICVLRGVHTDNPSHPGSSYEMMTGVEHRRGKGRDDIVDSRTDHPTYSSVVKRFRPAEHGVPGAVVLPQPFFNVPFYPGQHAGFLGAAWDPWLLECDPSAADFQVADLSRPADVSAARFDARRTLLRSVDDSSVAASQASAAQAAVRQYLDQAEEAFGLLGGERVRQAFDLAREPADVRDRYGRHKFGQACLLARRLVEAGVPLVQVNWPREPQEENPMWDAHWQLEKELRDELMPPMDQAYPTLLLDLEERGLLDETLVVWMGEFGRTPKLEYVRPHPAPGRNHWGHVFSVALAGGGVQAGAVYGASDRDGAYPASHPVGPGDLLATIFSQLGIDPAQEIHDFDGRPHPLARGRVIEEVL